MRITSKLKSWRWIQLAQNKTWQSQHKWMQHKWMQHKTLRKQNKKKQTHHKNHRTAVTLLSLLNLIGCMNREARFKLIKHSRNHSRTTCFSSRTDCDCSGSAFFYPRTSLHIRHISISNPRLNPVLPYICSVLHTNS